MCNHRFMAITFEGVTLSFSDRLAVAMNRAGMNRGELAEFLGISRPTLWRWENGRTKPAVAALRALATEAHLPYEWLKPFPDESGKGFSRYAPWDLNPEPTDSYTCLVIGVLSEAEAILRGLVTA